MRFRLKDVVTNPTEKAPVNGRGRIDLEDIAAGTSILADNADARRTRDGEGVRFASGDVLFGKLRPYLRKSYYCESDGLCSPELLVLRPLKDQLNPRFLYYLVASRYMSAWGQATSKGAKMPRTDFEALAQLRIDLPSLSTQERIVQVLDRQTESMARACGAAQQLVSHLTERHESLVQELTLPQPKTTKQGEFPWATAPTPGWETLRLGYVTRRVQTGSTPPTAETAYYEAGTLTWFGPGSFRAGLTLGEPSKHITELALERGKARLFPSGTILVVTIGATIGKVAQLEAPGSANQQVTALVAGPRAQPRFLAWQLKGLERVLRAIAPASTLPILDNDRLRAIPLPLPSLAEQEAHAIRLDASHSDLSAAERRLRDFMSLAQEKRDATITSAVSRAVDFPAF